MAAILGIEAMAACQGIELRSPLKTSVRLQRIISQIRQHCPALTEDRMVSSDIKALANFLSADREFLQIDEDLSVIEVEV